MKKTLLFLCSLVSAVFMVSAQESGKSKASKIKVIVDSLYEHHPYFTRDEVKAILHDLYKLRDTGSSKALNKKSYLHAAGSSDSYTDVRGRLITKKRERASSTNVVFRTSDITANSNATASSSNSVPDSIEYLALKALFESTGGVNWVNKNNWPYQSWPDASTVNSVNFAQWHGITVTGGDVVQIILTDNNLTGQIPSALGRLIKIKDLVISGNHITGLPNEIGDLVNLQYLSLGYNSLTSVPSELFTLSSLNYLYLYSNALTSISDDIGLLSNLTSLDYSDNHLDSIPSTIGNLANLSHLGLSGNNISYLPPELFQLTNLYSLSLAENRLEFISADIGNLVNLESLNLEGNRISGLPNEISQLQVLYDIDISSNIFTEFPSPLTQLTTLGQATLDNNVLSTLPGAMQQLTGLRYLSMVGNNFETLPAVISTMPSLEVLDVSGNQLTSIDSLTGSASLFLLFANDNHLTSLPENLSDLPQLDYLELDGNDFSAFPDELLELKTITGLRLSRSQLSELPVTLKDSLTLYDFVITGNKLDFGDLEPFFSAPGQSVFPQFDYNQQEEIIVDTSFSLPVGSSLDFKFPVAGEHNRYYWEKQDLSSGRWIPFDSTGNGFTRDWLTKSDDGLLRLRVMNDWVHGLTIYSRPIPVEVFYHNYVREETIFVEGVKEVSQVDTLQVVNGQKATLWTYYDGLQRVVQAIGQQQSPSKHDAIQVLDYDAVVRQNIGYLPFTSYPSDTSFYGGDLTPGSLRPKALSHEHGYFYNSPPPTIAKESKYPFGQTVFEDSPLGRPFKQGAPGGAWNVDSGRTVNYAYKAGKTGEVLFWTVMPDGRLQVDSSYLKDELRKTIVTDENGNVSIRYTDKFRRDVLQKKQVNDTTWLSTYTLYDQFNNVTFRVPPAAVELVMQQIGYPKILSQKDVERYCFRYKYDNENRLVEEQSPGTERMYYVHDKWGRIVLSQSGNQRRSNQWTYSKYDLFNRPIISGFCTDARNANEIRAFLQNLATEQRYELRDESGLHGYSSHTFPFNSGEVNTVNYYDDYSCLEDQLTDSAFHYSSNALFGLPDNSSDYVNDEITASKTRILGTSGYLWTIKYFDENHRVIQTVDLNHMGGIDRSSIIYNFAGWVLGTKTSHFENDPARKQILKQGLTYDHNGRLLTINHQINNQQEVQLSSMKYNELSQMIEKNLHVTESGTLQSIDYRKNIRGWLNNINNARLSVAENNDDNGDYFGMELTYDKNDDINAAPQFNGVISASRWSNALDTLSERAYSFSYDKSNRLLSASQHEKRSSWLQVENYNENQTYDANGNIKTLIRKDGHGSNLDVLEFTYTGNQLMTVTDTGDPTKGFKDGNILDDDYSYDTNGNLTKDKNLSIDTIYYYHFNRPDSLVFDNGIRIKYVYDATGNKLSQRVYNQTTLVDSQDYIGEFIYTDNTLEVIRHAEGRLTKSKVEEGVWVYEYNLTDYLGNVRVTFTTEPYTEIFMATMESQEASQEEARFLKIGGCRTPTSEFIDHTKKSKSPKVARLNGYHNIKEGPAKGLRVMPGDKVRMEVYVTYLDMRKSDPGLGAATILATLVTGGATKFPGDPGAVMQNSSSGKGPITGLIGNTEDLETPKAFLNYYLFDEMFNQIDAGFMQVTKTAAISEKHPNGNHEKLILEVKIRQAGYLFTNLSHDGNENVDVYFDDFKVTHEHGNIVQVQDYYPYGLPFNAKIKEHTVLNRYLYQGKEYDTLVQAYDFDSRQYFASIGRWFSNDPKGNVMPDISNYAAMMNNPVLYNDPNGECPICPFIPVIIGAIVGAYSGYKIAEAKGADSFGEWFGYIGGGAVIGAASGYVGGQIATAGGAFANTLAVAYTSAFSSIMMNGLSGGMTPVGISIGPASYDMTNNDLGYLGERGNKPLETVGYSIGAFSLASDVTAFIQEAYNSTASADLVTDMHSQITQPGTRNNILSWGAAQENGDRIITPEMNFKAKLPNAFRKFRNTQTNYDNGVDGAFYRAVRINRVNLVKLNSYVKFLDESNKFHYQFTSIVPINGMHCTIAASKALLNAGVFNIPVFRMPWLLDLQMRIRDYTHMSYIFNQQIK